MRPEEGGEAPSSVPMRTRRLYGMEAACPARIFAGHGMPGIAFDAPARHGRPMIFRTLLLAPVAALTLSVAAHADPVTLPGGTQIEDVESGTGAEARKGQTVTVHYTGWLYIDGVRGKRFDSSRGGEPFTFRLGAGDVIKGWDVGIVGMKEGGIRTLIIPPAAGYGARGDDTIPPNSTLMFEVELIKVR